MASLSFDERGTGTPVLLLHGFMQTRRSWDQLVGLLGPGRRYLIPDLPGHGDSRLAPTDFPAAVEATLRLLDAAGVARVHLTGYSLGGRLALAVAAAAPHRLLSLATIGAHAGLDEPERAQRLAADHMLAGRVLTEGIEWFAGYWAALPMFAGLASLGEERNRELDSMRRSLDAGGVASSLRGMGAGAFEPVWDRLAAVEAPSLFIAGGGDERYLEFAGRLREAVPGARTAIVPGAGHPAHLERPSAVADLLAAHWDHAR